MSEQQATDLAPFTYEPLAPGQIRLLMPTSDHDGLSWTMETVNLQDDISFDALSYVWGPQDKTFPIKCNNQKYYVHHNLCLALPYLAQRYTYRHSLIKRQYRDTGKQSVNNTSGCDDSKVESRDHDVMEEHDQNKPVGDLERDEDYEGGSVSDAGEKESERAATSDYTVSEGNTLWSWEKAQNHGSTPAATLQPIWIDALCIDQHNSEEKIIQVSLMNEIYRKASVTWIWLGLARNQHLIQDAIDWLPQIVWAVYCARKGSGEFGQILIDALRTVDPEVKETLHFILGNEWFRRVWILQEYVLAKSAVFLCGRHPIQADVLANALYQFMKIPSSSHKHRFDLLGNLKPAMALMVGRAWAQYQGFKRADVSSSAGLQHIATTMLVLSEQTNLFGRCFLAQDRVFGILGILTTAQYQAFGEDLFGTRNIAELYTRFSAAMLPLALSHNRKEEAWRWLSYAFEEKKTLVLPSWVPDLQRSFPMHLNFSYLRKASHRDCVAVRGKELGELIIRGTVTHTISSVCTPNPVYSKRSLADRPSYFPSLAAWEEKANSFCTGLPPAQRWKSIKSQSHSELEDIYWQTLVCCLPKARPETETYESYKAFFIVLHSYRHNIEKALASATGNSTHGRHQDGRQEALAALKLLVNPSTESGRFRHRVESAIEDKDLFRTADGTIGLTNKGVLPGDKVCVFSGAPTPHVLRRVPGRLHETYRFVGYAYVHVLMNGEVDDMGLPEQDILLV